MAPPSTPPPAITTVEAGRGRHRVVNRSGRVYAVPRVPPLRGQWFAPDAVPAGWDDTFTAREAALLAPVLSRHAATPPRTTAATTADAVLIDRARKALGQRLGLNGAAPARRLALETGIHEGLLTFARRPREQGGRELLEHHRAALHKILEG